MLDGCGKRGERIGKARWEQALRQWEKRNMEPPQETGKAKGRWDGRIGRETMEYKYLLFDLDGTLTDPREGITTSVQYALKAFGIEEPDREKLTPFIGPPLRGSFQAFYGFSEAQAQEAVEKYREWFAPKGIFQNEIYDGIAQALKAWKEKGKVLAVASSKPTVYVEKILEHFKIRAYFSVVVGSELDGTRDSKEEVVEEALRQLEGLGQEDKLMQGGGRTVMVGDRKFDVEGGKRHGLVTVGVSFGYAQPGELEAAGADYVVDTVEELKELLMR